MRETRKRNIETQVRIDRLVDTVLQLVEYQQRFIQQLGPVVQSQRTMESNFQQFLTAQLRTSDQLEKLTIEVRALTGRVDLLSIRTDELAQGMVQLTGRVDQLAVRMDQLTERMDQLAVRMDQLTERMDQLAEAQRRADERIEALAARMDELAEAQVRTDERLESLAERVEELTEAQRRTEERLDRTNRQLGDLSMSFGYLLENQAYKHLPALLEGDYGISIQGKLTRTYVEDVKGHFIEVNILGEGIKNGDTYYIVGECKSQLSINSINRFIHKKLEQIAVPSGKKVFPIFVCHMVSGPDVAAYARQRGIALYFSHQFD